jgi:hypothetical protein
MLTESCEKVAKVAKVLYCSICHYTTSRKSSYDKHILTSKHKMMTNVDVMLTDVVTTKKSNRCKCGKLFKCRQSLHVHKKKCYSDVAYMTEETDTNKVEGTSDKDLIMLLIKENSDFKTMMMEQSNMMMEVIKNGTHNTTNSHNKSFNLQFFLNETCKHAMNITDFVESIKLQLSDLERVGELGYVEGISNIIVKSLKGLDITQRPVHCTDKKRETMYIKDENKWEKDEEQKKMHKMVRKVADKNARMLPKFKEAHPDCIKSTSLYSDQYNQIIMESMGGKGDNDFEKEEKIIKKVSKEVMVEKEL